jgi:hypothetical protein
MKLIHWLIEHWPDVILAVILAAIADLLRVGSGLRTAARHIKNKIAERSADNLRSRISVMERQRDRMSAYLTSDKALYLGILNFVFGTLICLCAGALCFTLDRFFPLAFLTVAGLLFFGMGIWIAFQGTQVTSLDTADKIGRLVSALHGEIALLEEKLKAKTAKP